MNMDYAICNALKYQSFGLPQALVIYDIGCQWIINFLKRLKQNHLSIPEAMELLVAVGKFHLSAHVQECFVLYSLNFMYGSGQIDGEILETLWSPFNFISASARTMSMASRHQLYDDHMRDSNWKKIVGIGECHIFQNCVRPSRHLLLSVKFSFYSLQEIRKGNDWCKGDLRSLS